MSAVWCDAFSMYAPKTGEYLCPVFIFRWMHSQGSLKKAGCFTPSAIQWAVLDKQRSYLHVGTDNHLASGTVHNY
jgi:hypothetical protein